MSRRNPAVSAWATTFPNSFQICYKNRGDGERFKRHDRFSAEKYLNQQDAMVRIGKIVQRDSSILGYAQNIGNAIVDGPANHCAATLSALLIFSGIYPNRINTSSGNLEAWVPTLAADLQTNLSWSKIDVSAPFYAGDVGVIMLDTVHHVYLVVDATDQLTPIIADNRSPSVHPRAVQGNPQQGWSPTTYFLRPPTS